MSEFYAEKKNLKKTGRKVESWGCGYGMERYPTIIKEGVWCVMVDGKIYAEARGKQKCMNIISAMNSGSNK